MFNIGIGLAATRSCAPGFCRQLFADRISPDCRQSIETRAKRKAFSSGETSQGFTKTVSKKPEV
jgi:hypothetical protein